MKETVLVAVVIALEFAVMLSFLIEVLAGMWTGTVTNVGVRFDLGVSVTIGALARVSAGAIASAVADAGVGMLAGVSANARTAVMTAGGPTLSKLDPLLKERSLAC